MEIVICHRNEQWSKEVFSWERSVCMFVEKLTEEQIREIMNLISDDGLVQTIQIRSYDNGYEDCLNWSKVPEIKAKFQETEETYHLYDYHIEGFHYAGAGSDLIYRKLMYSYFGEPYALNYLRHH